MWLTRTIFILGGSVMLVDVLSRWLTLPKALVTLNTGLSALVYPITGLLLIWMGITMREAEKPIPPIDAPNR